MRYTPFEAWGDLRFFINHGIVIVDNVKDADVVVSEEFNASFSRYPGF